MEESDSELQEVEVESCFFDSFVELPMVRVESLDSVDLGDEPSEFTVESHKVSSFYFLENEVNVLLEVAGINLHLLYR